MLMLFAVPIVASTVPFGTTTQVERIPVPPPVQRWLPTPPSWRFVPQKKLPKTFFQRPPVDRSWRYPLATKGRVSSRFGWRIHPVLGGRRFHAGLDIAAPTGTPVLATTSGYINFAGNKGGYGKTIILSHADGQTQTLYAHLSTIAVRPRQRVRSGQVIGRVGSTGRSTGPHLHFEVRKRRGSKWQAVNPEPLLRRGRKRRNLANLN